MAVPDKILESVRAIKPLSESATRLIKITNDPEHGIREIIQVVESDAALTGNLLRVVNSTAFGVRTQITTVERTVSYLGDKMVAGIALNMCASYVFNNPLDGYESERGVLWRHSLWTAIASREIARCSAGKVSPETAYTAGLLHDVGEAVISSYLDGRTREMVQAVESEQGGDYIAAEENSLGTNHCEVGEALAVHWRLPAPLVEAVRHHHSPADAGPELSQLVYAVHLGDIISMMGGSGTGADTLLYRLDERYKKHFTISIRDLEKIVILTRLEFDKTVDAMFGSTEEVS